MEKKINQIKSSLIKIVLFGPESTGKSTLSNALAKHYKSVCVPEYARDFLQSKWDMYRKTCEKEDLWAIAKGQEKLENEISKKAISMNLNGLMIETHNYPKKALSDANQQINSTELKELIKKIKLN